MCIPGEHDPKREREREGGEGKSACKNERD